MKHCSLLKSRLMTRHRAWLALALATTISITLPRAVPAQMQEMTDSQLRAVTATGFSRFTLENINGIDVARADFNISASTYTEIDSMKLGYYDNGTGPGWDQNWTAVAMGDTSNDMVMDGFYIRSEFVNVDDPATRELKSVTIGWTSVTGNLTADFQSLSLSGDASRQPAGQQTYQFNGDPLALTIAVDGPDKGVRFDFGGATPVATP